MCLYSDFWKEWDKYNLAPYAVKSNDAWYNYREFTNPESNNKNNIFFDQTGSESRYKTNFGMDIERILDSQAFRRLEYKTQMFVNHEGDNYRTRLTHTLEVVMIAKYLAKALRLNSDLVEAIGLGHDLGHAPFGHAGEEAINEMIKTTEGDLKQIKKDLESNYYFCHNRQSLEVVEQLEKGYEWDRREGDSYKRGLNLTLATREGIVTHTNRGLEKHKLRVNYQKKKICYPGSLEAQIVRLADEIAQRTHDLEDGLRSGLLTTKDIVKPIIMIIDEMIWNIGKNDSGYFFKNQKKEIFPIHLFKENLSGFIEIISEELKKVNKKVTNEQYDNVLQKEYIERLFVVISRLLFIWRSEEYFNSEHFSSDDKNNYVNRILKYMYIYLQMRLERASAANISGFLRGLFISNTIENSFSNIKSVLRMDKSVENGITIPSKIEKKSPFYLVFINPDKTSLKACVVKIEYSRKKPPIKGLWFGSDGSNSASVDNLLDKEQISPIIKRWLKITALENKRTVYANILTDGWSSTYRVNWLNKHKDIQKCGGIKIILDKNKPNPIKVGINQVQIYFTQIDYSELDGASEEIIKERINDKLVIKFSNEMMAVDKIMEEMIKNRVHHHSKVERMNVKGVMIIKRLFKEYWKHPRIMNTRVWKNLTKYNRYNNLIRNNKKLFQEYKGDVPNNEQLEFFHNRNQNIAQLLLCRRIIDYISGMTDRFIYEEYARLFSPQKEIESVNEVIQFD